MTQLPVPGIESEGKPFSAAGPGSFAFVQPGDCSSPGENDGRRVFPAGNFTLPRILCIILSLLVHLALIAMPGPPSVSRSQVVMEFSLVAGPPGPEPQASAQGGTGGNAPAPEIGRKAPAQPPTVKQAVGKPAPQRSRTAAPSRETNQDRQRSKPLTPAPATRPVRPVPSEEARPARLMAPPAAEPPAPAEAASADSSTSSTSTDGSGNAPAAAMNASGVQSSGNGASGSGLSRFGGLGGGPVYVFGEAGAPTFLRRVAPKYPRSSLARREQGVVMLLLSLNRHGTLLDVSVTQSAGPRLDEAAIQAARASSYLPATRNGEPHACTATLPIRFTLRQ